VLGYGQAMFGDAAVARFDRDVLSVPGVGWLVVLEGINDIGQGGDARPSAEVMIAGYQQIIERAHAHGLKVYLATMLPFQGARYYADAGEVIRQKVNDWIRQGHGFEGVIDLDAAIRDPANPKKKRTEWQSGDWLHPNDAGYKVMGDAIDLKLFR
jgi:lysophospholipase L1-like esterase